MKIVDFMVVSGGFSHLNYVLVENSELNRNELKQFGCTDDEIVSMYDDDEGNYLDVYETLIHKGYHFSPGTGFYKDTSMIADGTSIYIIVLDEDGKFVVDESVYIHGFTERQEGDLGKGFFLTRTEAERHLPN